MPPAPYDKMMTDQERQLLGTWILAGAPETSSAPTPGPTSTPPNTPPSNLVLTYTHDILPIFQMRCGECHNKDVDALPNWQEYKTAFNFRKEIDQRVNEDQSMPPNNLSAMTDYERAEIHQWILVGAKK